jgi:hypothetical protein
MFVADSARLRRGLRGLAAESLQLQEQTKTKAGATPE